MWEIIGYTASILSASTFVPEVISAVKSRHLNDLAWGMLALLVMNNLLWVIYAVYFAIFPVVLSSSLNVIMGMILVVIKWQSEREAKVIPVEGGVRIMVKEK